MQKWGIAVIKVNRVDFDPDDRQRPKDFTEVNAAWELLAAAIIKAALEDYKYGTIKRRNEIERFIKSEYFDSISNIDPKWLIKTLHETMPLRCIEHI